MPEFDFHLTGKLHARNLQSAADKLDAAIDRLQRPKDAPHVSHSRLAGQDHTRPGSDRQTRR